MRTEQRPAQIHGDIVPPVLRVYFPQGTEGTGTPRIVHQEIHRAAHSPQLLIQIRHAARVVPTNFLTVFPEHEHHSLEDHQKLVTALADRDAEASRAIAERHVLDAGRSLAEWLAQACVTG